MSPDLIMSLKNDSVLNLRIIGVDNNPNPLSKHLVDSFYQVPMGTDEGFIIEILRIANIEKAEIIIPGSDQEAYALSSIKSKLIDLGIKISTSSIYILETIKNKLKTYQVLKERGITVPKHSVVNNETELKLALDQFNYPNKSVALKPIYGRGGRGLVILESENDPLPEWVGSGLREKKFKTKLGNSELNKCLSDAPILIMAALRDPAYDIDILAANGKIKNMVIRRRYNPVGIPFTGNSIEVNDLIYNYCEKITLSLGLDGLHDIDLMSDEKGNPVLLEVNPRMSGSVAASHAGGFPIVSMAIAHLLGVFYPFDAPVRNIEIGVSNRCLVLK